MTEPNRWDKDRKPRHTRGRMGPDEGTVARFADPVQLREADKIVKRNDTSAVLSDGHDPLAFAAEMAGVPVSELEHLRGLSHEEITERIAELAAKRVKAAASE